MSANKKFVNWLSLFTSFGTLICCAIPSLLVVLGMGATLAGLIGQFPQMVWLSEHKNWIFGTSFGLLLIAGLARATAAKQACPVDAREACETTKDWSGPVFWIAVIINLIGAFVTFILPRLLAE